MIMHNFYHNMKELSNMTTILKNLGDIPMGDDYFAGIVNRKSAIEKKIEAYNNKNAYGKEAPKKKKNFRDDRNQYERSRYGQIPYSGMGENIGDELGAARKKKKKLLKRKTRSAVRPAKNNVLAKKTPTQVKANVKIKKIKKARKEKAYTGMGEYLGAKKKAAPRKAAPKKGGRISAGLVSMAKGALAMVKKPAAAPAAVIVQPSGSAVSTAAVSSSFKKYLTPMNMGIAGGAVAALIALFLVLKKKPRARLA